MQSLIEIKLMSDEALRARIEMELMDASELRTRSQYDLLATPFPCMLVC